MDSNLRCGRAGWRELHIALATASSIQASIRHADSKAATLLAVQGAAAVTGADHSPALASTMLTAAAPLWWKLTIALLAGCLATGLVNGTWQLFASLYPRLAGPPGANRFGFPNVARMRRPAVAPVGRQRDEAWDLVVALADIAVVKHARVRRGLPWIALGLVSLAALLLMEMLATALAH